MNDETPGQPLADATKRPSLKKRAVEATVVIAVGNGTQQGIRFVTNILLAWVLFPEAFGLMAIVNSFIHGLQLFSDVGIGASIIQKKDAEDREFLETAWTLQIIRGFVLWGCAALIAVPVASIYKEESLLLLLPVVALSMAIKGFDSTAVHRLQRNLYLGRLTILDQGSHLVSVGVMVICALVYRSVWALVAGGLAGAVFHAIISHSILPGERDRIRWNREAARELLQFGGWIFLTTPLAWVVRHGHPLLLGLFMSIGEVGIFSIAMKLAQISTKYLSQQGRKVLFPLFSRLSERGIDAVRGRMFTVRTVTLSVGLLIPLVLMLWGDRIVMLIYDDRYFDAAWMVQILAAGALFTCFMQTSGPLVLGLGDSYRLMVVTAARACCMVAGMLIGQQVAGLLGMIIGYALIDVIAYPVMAWALDHHTVWMPKLDLSAMLLCGVVVFIKFCLIG